MSILLLDFNNLSIRNVFADKETINNPNPDFGIHKDKLLQSIFYNINKFKPSEVILAVDDGNCWRKKIYPDYKAHRQNIKDNNIFPWDKYAEYIKEYVKEIKATFPFIVLQVPYCEADDIIAVISKHKSGVDKVVVTADSDYIQLLSLPKIKLYNPLVNKFVSDDNPKLTMEVKIVGGDVGDNIRSIEKRKKGEDPIIKKRIGKETAFKLIQTGELEELLKNELINENYKRNQKLVDWNNIPNIIQSKILEGYSTYVLSKNINNNELFNFLVRNRLRNHLENISTIKMTIKPLYDGLVNKDFLNFCEGN